jgi:FtsZ-binding cell division protein ZapB
MKFAEIYEELNKKQKVIQNTINHINFEIQKLEETKDDLESDYAAINNALASINSLSAQAE